MGFKSANRNSQQDVIRRPLLGATNEDGGLGMSGSWSDSVMSGCGMSACTTARSALPEPGLEPRNLSVKGVRFRVARD